MTVLFQCFAIHIQYTNYIYTYKNWLLYLIHMFLYLCSLTLLNLLLCTMYPSSYLIHHWNHMTTEQILFTVLQQCYWHSGLLVSVVVVWVWKRSSVLQSEPIEQRYLIKCTGYLRSIFYNIEIKCYPSVNYTARGPGLTLFRVKTQTNKPTHKL